MKKDEVKGIPFQNNASLERKYARLVKSIMNRHLLKTYKEILSITKKWEKIAKHNKSVAFDEKMPSDYESEVNVSLRKFLIEVGITLTDDAITMADFLSENIIKLSDLAFEKNVLKLEEALKVKEKGVRPTLEIEKMSEEFKDKVKQAIERNQKLRQERKVKKDNLAKSLTPENKIELRKLADSFSERVKKAVYKSVVTDMNPGTLEKEFKTILGMSERQAKNAALDQTRKVYSEVNRLNLIESGVKKFEWLHVSGSTYPRQLHIELSGQIFEFDNPPIIDEPSGRRGFPGDEYNCRCIMIPVI